MSSEGIRQETGPGKDPQVDLVRRLHLVIEAGKIGTWDYDVSTATLLWDKRCREMFGMNEDDPVSYELFLERIHPDDRERTNEVNLNALRGDNHGEYTLDYRTIGLRDSKLRWVHARGQAYKDERGVIYRFTGAVIDITAEKEREQTLRMQEERFRLLVTSIPQIVWTTDPSGAVDYISDTWQAYTAHTPTYMGASFRDLIHPEDLPKVAADLDVCFATGATYKGNYRLRNLNTDAYRWFSATIAPVKDDSGQVIKWVGSATEIHDQKMNEIALEHKVAERTKDLREINARLEKSYDELERQSRELEQKTLLLDNILRHSSNGISVSRLIFDDNGQVIDAQTILANEAAVRYAGIPKEDYLSKPATYFDPGIIASPYGQACIRTSQTGEPFIIRYFLDFSKRWLELTVSKMDDSHLIHHFTDVTTIREAELTLERTLEELRHSNENLEQFAYAASHDLREPIRKSQVYINLLKKGLQSQLTESQMQSFERLENSQIRMKTLIEDLLEYSKLSKGILPDQQRIDLNECIRPVLDDLEVEIEQRKAQIHVGTLHSIIGNPRQIQQLFQNLLGNALKYSKQDVPPVIDVSSAQVKGKDLGKHCPAGAAEKTFYLIKIADNGIGFDQKHADKIFALFTRLHAGEYYKGSGIGLSIVRKIVETHHGHIWAESEPERGAVFSILFPDSPPEQL